MTKALEAAADAYAIDHWDMKLLALPAERQERARRRAKEIIRAYAANVTEEMVAECADDVNGCCGNCLIPWKASPEQIQAAIERGLV